MAKVNRNYCKPDAEMKPVFAPAVFRYNGVDYWHPEKEDFAIVGYLPLSPDAPVDPPQGKHYVQTDMIEANGDEGWRWKYVLVDDPPAPPRRFSKLKIVAALMLADAWRSAKAYIEAQGLYDLFLAAQDFADDDPYFLQGKAALQGALDMSDAQVEAILAASVTTEGV